MHRLRAAFAVLFLLVAFVACGGDDDDDDAASNDDTSASSTDEGDDDEGEDDSAASGDASCALSTEQVEEVTGIEVDDPEANIAGNGCDWSFNEGTGSVSVRLFEKFGKQSHEGFVEAFDDAEELEVDGNDAAWSESVGTLDIVVGDDGLQVQIVQALGDDITDVKATCIELAQLVLDER
jgi:hypothetical protein